MAIGELCTRQVVIARREESARVLAELMRQHHVGDLVVVETEAAGQRPLGIVTDRDLVIEVLARQVAPESVTAGDIMSSDLLTAREDEELAEALARMRHKGVRRLVVVDRAGHLVGILATDDVVELIAEQLSDLRGLVEREQDREADLRGDL